MDEHLIAGLDALKDDFELSPPGMSPWTKSRLTTATPATLGWLPTTTASSMQSPLSY